MAGGKDKTSANGNKNEKYRKVQDDGEAGADSNDQLPTVKKQKVNTAQPWLADERANDSRLVEKALFTRAVFLTQRLAACLHMRVLRSLKDQRRYPKLRQSKKLGRRSNRMLQKTTSTLWRAQSRTWRLRVPLVSSLWVTWRSLMIEKP